jgi:hypothetical protein
MQELHGIGNDIQDLIYKKLTALMIIENDFLYVQLPLKAGYNTMK